MSTLGAILDAIDPNRERRWQIRLLYEGHIDDRYHRDIAAAYPWVRAGVVVGPRLGQHETAHEPSAREMVSDTETVEAIIGRGTGYGAVTLRERRAAHDDEARQLFQAGRMAFDDARYEDALSRFQEAHRMSGRPELLYNIGQCLDRLRRDVEAIATFEQFVAAAPDAANRHEVEQRLQILRAAVARGATSPPDDTPPPASVHVTAPDPADVAPASHSELATPTQPTPVFVAESGDSGLLAPAIISAAAAGLFLVGGVVLSVLWEGRAQAYRITGACNTRPTEPDCVAILDQYNIELPLGITSYVLAGALGITSAVLFYLDLSRPRSSPSLACVPGVLGVACAMRF